MKIWMVLVKQGHLRPRPAVCPPRRRENLKRQSLQPITQRAKGSSKVYRHKGGEVSKALGK